MAAGYCRVCFCSLLLYCEIFSIDFYRPIEEEEERLFKPNTLDGRPSLRFTKTAHARVTLRSVGLYYNNVYLNIFVT